MIKKFLYSQKTAPYLFISPFILVFCSFFIYPMISTVQMSFQDILPGQVTFIGFDNYTKLLSDTVFFTAVKNSFVYMIGSLLLLIPFPMLYACVINSKAMKFGGIYKAVMYLPALTSVVVAGTLFSLAFSDSPDAFMNQIVQFFGGEAITWKRQEEWAMPILLLLCCWRWTGVNMMYYLSGLKGIPEELYESADIDGASVWQKFIKITIPMLQPTTIYVLTISVYAGLAMFTESYMIWGSSSPKNMSLTIVGYLYKQGIERNDLGYASTVGIVLLILAMTINLIQLRWNGVLKKEGK